MPEDKTKLTNAQVKNALEVLAMKKVDDMSYEDFNKNLKSLPENLEVLAMKKDNNRSHQDLNKKWEKVAKIAKNEEDWINQQIAQGDGDVTISIVIQGKDGRELSLEEYYEEFPWNRPGLSSEEREEKYQSFLNSKNSDLQAPPDSKANENLKTPGAAKEEAQQEEEQKDDDAPRLN